MSNFIYRYRIVAALLGAAAMGALAVAVLPVAAGNLGRTIAVAGTPSCSGSQNPFIGSPS
jgi:hypothetical protein